MEPRAPTSLETSRLLLREFTLDDVEAQAHILSDPLVTRYLPAGPYPADRARDVSLRTISYFMEHWEKNGFGVWAVVDKQSGKLIGRSGLNILPETPAETPEVEVLYLLSRPFWGQGLATEGARAAVDIGFDNVGLGRIVGLTLPENIASQRVLEKVGLRYEKDAHFFGLDVRYFSVDRERRLVRVLSS